MAKPSQYQANEPFHVQDGGDMYNNHPPPMISPAPMPTAQKPARQPLQNASPNVVLNPPPTSLAKQSPLKPNARSSNPNPGRAPPKPSQGSKLGAVQMAPPNNAQRQTDSLEKRQPVMSRFKTVAQKPQPDFHIQYMQGQNNSHPPLYPAPPQQSQFNLPLESYYQKPPAKRALLEPAPIKEQKPAKKQKVNDPVPPPDSFPPIIDDGTKPNHSYATLIGMAILRSPQRRLTLSQIYKWISDTYSYYSSADSGWQNSIRHNLSLNKHFIKQERPKDDPGKGNYWSIEPGAEHLFIKEKPSRKSAATAENMPVMSTRLEPSQPKPSQPKAQPKAAQPKPQPKPQAPRMPEPALPPQVSMPPSSLPSLPPTSSQQLAPAPLPADISSDATIPASDTGSTEPAVDRQIETEPLNEPELYSPFPAAMHSSPPVPKRLEARHTGTPPSRQQMHPSSATKPHSSRRRCTSMDDSGYISSLESSVMRPYQHSKPLASEADRSRIKRGRAEEEIARLRASSYDSPSKGRSYASYPPPSSSPIRRTSRGNTGQMLPPLTPAMKLKAPPKPPPSVSPSTNLRLHRENIQSLVESPFRRVSALLPESDNAGQLTPGFDIDPLWYDLEHRTDENSGFDIFDDAAPFHSVFSLTPTVAPNGSPAKRSTKKQRPERSQSTSASNDGTDSNHGTANSASFLKVPNQASNLTLETPSKVFEGLPSSPSKVFVDLQSPSKMPPGNDENLDPWVSLEGLDAPDFLEDNDFSGFDMLAGFEKIGSNNAQASRAAKSSSSQKPASGRSLTTPF